MFKNLLSTYLCLQVVVAIWQPLECCAQMLILNQQTFYDQGTNGPVASHTMLVPKGWEVEGKAHWGGANYYNIVPSQNIRMKSPAGYMVHVGPTLNASDFTPSQTALNQGFKMKPELEADNGRMVLYRPTTPQQWKSFYEEKCVPELRKKHGITNVRVIEVSRVPELVAVIDAQMGTLKQELAQRNQQLRESNVVQSCDCEAIAIRFTYQENGIDTEAVNVIGMNSILTQNYLGTRVDWNSQFDVILAAPVGKLENAMPELVSIARSVREIPNWSRLKNEHLAKLRGIEMSGFVARQKIMTDTFSEISRIQSEGYRSRSQSSDRSHARYIDAIREVDRYSQGGYQYELPSGYDNVYGDGQGNFVLTDNALFNPNTDLESSANWTALNADR